VATKAKEVVGRGEEGPRVQECMTPEGGRVRLGPRAILRGPETGCALAAESTTSHGGVNFRNISFWLYKLTIHALSLTT
jgi:hypothetical protein